MHELAIAQNILESVKGLRDAAGRKPTAVNVKVGPFANVSKPSLEFGFDASVSLFGLEGCKLVFEEVSARLGCDCGNEFAFTGSFDCPKCARPALKVLSGRELLVDSVEFPDEEPSCRS